MKQRAQIHFFHNEKGSTLIEAMITILIFFIVVVGGGTFFYGGNMMTDRAKIRRLAIDKAVEKMEWITSLDYSQIDGQSEAGTIIQLDTKMAVRKVSVIAVDDSLDGLSFADQDGNTIDYKKAIVEIAWMNSDSQRVRLESIFYSN